MADVIEGLRLQGAHDFAQQAVRSGDLTGIRLDDPVDSLGRIW